MDIWKLSQTHLYATFTKSEAVLMRCVMRGVTLHSSQGGMNSVQNLVYVWGGGGEGRRGRKGERDSGVGRYTQLKWLSECYAIR